MQTIRALEPNHDASCSRCGLALAFDETAAHVRGIRGDSHWLHGWCVRKVCARSEHVGVETDPPNSVEALVDFCASSLRVRPTVGDAVATLRELFPNVEVAVDVTDPPLDLPPPTIDDVIARIESMQHKLASMSETLEKMQRLVDGTSPS